MFETIFPGESARLLSLWNGLDSATATPYPLMGLFAKPFGLTNGLAPVLLVLAAVGVYVFVSRLVRSFTNDKDTARDAGFAGRLAGAVSTVAFLLSPAAISAGTHVEPALFGLVATLISSLALMGALAARSAACYLFVFGSGALFGFFSGECPLASVCAVPASIAVVWGLYNRVRAGRAFAALALFGFGFAAGFMIHMGVFSEGLVTALVTAKRGLLYEITLADGGGARIVFAVLPFLAASILVTGAFGDRPRTKRTTIGHLAVLVLVAFGLFADFAANSVASAALVAIVLGETLAYFVVTARADYRTRPAAGTRFRNVKFVFRSVAAGALTVFALVSFGRAVTSIDRSYAFADRFAARLLDGLGSRTWLVTDGRLDDHLRILAARRGLDIAFVDVSRDFDPAAKKTLSAFIEKRLGDRAPELLRSLDLGILPFLEDWLRADPDAARDVAVFAAPDLLFACGQTPVPEVFFFGTDPAAPADWSVWKDLADILPAPKGWGSFRMTRTSRDPLARRRLDFRRYLGLVANNRGVWLQDHGDDDGAYRLYTLVLDEIDTDNVSALFNVLAMADAGYKPAAQRAGEWRRKMKTIVADESRRYRLWALANYYGTVRNVPALLQLGFAWAKSGRPGEAISQIRRAADLIPSDKRANLMNMIASLLADSAQRQESRAIYEKRLAERSDDHDALIGLVRLELLDGDEKKAKAYLERAVAAGGDDPRVRTELALLAMMKGDARHAREILKSVTASDPKNVRAWSLLSAATIQLSDASTDPAVRASLDQELEKVIVPTMQTHARGADNYFVYSARAFLALRKGEAGRKAAREALMAAMQTRPDVPVTREMLIGMDIALNEPLAAEQHARQTLRLDRNSPMANYVMGSLALGKDDLRGAEAYLKKAVKPAKPSAFALNDYAETLRLQGRAAEAEPYARRVVREYPGLYAGWDTLACVILDMKGSLDEALKASQKAVELVTKDGRAQDAGVLLTLARIQKAKGDRKPFNMTIRKVESRLKDLSPRQRRDYDALRREDGGK